MAAPPDSGTITTDPPAPDGLARPQDFAARYGDGLDLGVSLGGGGVFFVAWQVAYLHELAEHDVGLGGAERLVGTSAGSVVASVLAAGHLGRFFREVSVLSKAPKLLGALAPAGDLHPSQVRARDEFALASDNDPDTIRRIGHAALAAQTPAASVMSRNVGIILGSRKWPGPGLHVTCADAFTGERCVITKESKIAIAKAVASSSAVPGLFAPQPIGDRRCMDGGVSGSGTHLDLLAGARRAVVLSLTDGSDVAVGMMTSAVGSTEAEHAALRASGTDLFLRTPDAIDPVKLMDPDAVPEAIAMGRRQAAADIDALRSFLA
jgi:NTE family protein